ncbi:MAG: 50S ribosomal protein L1 [Deltaproteobacteria bacterium]|nr:MAG: 50S ribosomal protein L1 [Deltaproteobacteria bacterium]
MRGKKYRYLLQKLEGNRLYSLHDAYSFFQEIKSNFDETVDIAVCLSKEGKQEALNIRGFVVLPHALGKTVKIAVIAKGNLAEEARKAGADIVGDEDLVNKIENGFLGFDKLIVTPDLMGLISKLGKTLGPKGLMPNMKLGTVSADVTKAIKDLQGGRIEFKSDKGNIIHAPVGLLSFSRDQLRDNINVFLDAISKMRPSSIKGNYIKKIVVSSTMSPGIKLDIAQLN